MRFLALSLLLACTMQHAPAAPAAPAAPVAPAAQPADLFDFWLGDWSVTWTKPDGSLGKARNHVSRILDGQVIEEQFEMDPAEAPQQLKGRSLSVRDPAGLWHQAWADNQGGFFALTGSADGDKRLFSTALAIIGREVKGQRMVFHHITADAFTWDWEGSTDGGKTWKLLWRLDYERRSAAAAQLG